MEWLYVKVWKFKDKELCSQGPPTTTMKDSLVSGEYRRQMEAIIASFAVLLWSVTKSLQK